MIAILVYAGLMLLVIIGAVWNAYVLTILWEWFVVPTFDLPLLSLIPAIGIVMTVSYLTHQYIPNVAEQGSKWEKLSRPYVYIALKPALALVFGWTVKQWM